jgi:hypothetical protein
MGVTTIAKRGGILQPDLADIKEGSMGLPFLKGLSQC